MPIIKDLSFLEIDVNLKLIGGITWAQVHGSAQTGAGFAVATIGSTSVGALTLTTANTSTTTLNSPLLSKSTAYAFGTAFAHDNNYSARSSARYGSIYAYRH